MKRHERKKEKCEKALRLNEQRLKRSPRQQIKLLDRRPGKAIRERHRLWVLIDAGNGDVKGLRQFMIRK